MLAPHLSTDRLLGTGAMGSVYLAQDPKGGSHALKVLKAEANPLLEMFEREVGILSKLKHPRLVEIEGFSKSGEGIRGIGSQPCFWMEFIEGKPLLEAAQEADTQTILTWFQESLDAMEYLHGQGILHGDLKPANILVQQAGGIKLVDFGLAALAQSIQKSPGQAKGSIPYLAPEVLDGERLPASDLFSLGTLFYQALAGRHPRAEAKNLKGLFATPIKKLSAYGLDIPSATARVIERLLEPDLGIRLKTAKEAKEALLQENPEQEHREVSFHSYRMFGMEPRWDQLLQYAAKLREEKKPGIAFIHGLTGVGKSRFVREASFELALQGARIQNLELPSERPLLESLDLREGEGNLSEESLTLFVGKGVDEWNPKQLRDLYLYLRSHSPAPRLLLLEYNDEGLNEFQRNFLEILSMDPRVLDLTLGNLAPPQSKEFLNTCLGAELPNEILQDLQERTQGNPKLLTETCREILRSKILQKKRLTPELLQQISLPKTARDLYLKRLDGLGAEAKTILNHLATALGRVDLKLLLNISEGELTPLRKQLEELLRLGLIKQGSNRGSENYQISHPTLGDLVLASLSPEQKAAIHRKWLHLLAAPDTPVETLAPPLSWELAHHVVELSDHPRRVDWTLKAGGDYSLREDHAKALALYLKCLEGTTDPAAREILLRTLINTLGRMGRFAEANEYLETWFSEYPEDSLGINRVKYWLSSAVNYQNQGNLKEARRRLRKCLEAGNPDSDHHRSFIARSYSLLGHLDIQEENFSSAKENFEMALKLLPEDSAQKAEVYKHQALWAVEQNNWEEALRQFSFAQRMYGELKNPLGLFSVALEKGNLALKSKRIQESEEAYHQALELASQLKDEASLARVYQNLGVIDCRQGFYARALENLEKAREIFAYLGNPNDRSLNFIQLALAYASVGLFKKSESMLVHPRNTTKLPENLQQRLKEIEFQIHTLKRGYPPDSQSPPPGLLERDAMAEWDLEKRLFKIALENPARSQESHEILSLMHERLPNALKIRFEDRGDYRRWVLNEEILPSEPTEADEIALPIIKGEKTMDILQKVADITKELLSTENLNQVLVKLMDAAMEFSNAEHGFLILKSPTQEGPFPGFEVKVARNVAKELLVTDDFALSISAVKEAMETGSPLVTDNALQDTRFETAESVHHLELKSILAMPLNGTTGVIGALYLDHPYKTEIFQEADLNILQILTDQAALALQKSQMIQDLQNANLQLTDTVEIQADELSVLKREVEDQREQLKHEYKDIIGHSPAMLEVLSLVDRVTETRVPVWIFGESGTGKEMIARALHFNSTRAKNPFVSENCSALPETLLESELFGHKKGAFTHADRDKKGLLEYANGGTVFLDEIADMSPAMQSKLLRFLQEGEIRPLGSNNVVKVDVRTVSASNKNLQKLVAEEKFREDLYYRLNGVTVLLPPLRKRMEDIPLLVQHFLKKIAKEEEREALEIATDSLELLMEYEWPGNVRELENTLRTAALFNQKGKLIPKSFNFKRPLFEKGVPASSPVESTRQAIAEKVVQSAPKAKPMAEEKKLLLQALYDAGFHKGNAAKTLGISRRYLYTQLLRHSVPVNRIEMKAYIETELGMG